MHVFDAGSSQNNTYGSAILALVLALCKGDANLLHLWTTSTSKNAERFDCASATSRRRKAKRNKERKVQQLKKEKADANDKLKAGADVGKIVDLLVGANRISQAISLQRYATSDLFAAMASALDTAKKLRGSNLKEHRGIGNLIEFGDSLCLWFISIEPEALGRSYRIWQATPKHVRGHVDRLWLGIRAEWQLILVVVTSNRERGTDLVLYSERQLAEFGNEQGGKCIERTGVSPASQDVEVDLDASGSRANQIAVEPMF
ncbi:hypothetical protein BKA70DRAFT_1237722 [Coprinopsis sp. MPI-PUGE-AT-0042]|nr:hypothetical protein BKA70DRAFT_1237722 [Coprinopsis sp. MPI-PUGE-AT-0042]